MGKNGKKERREKEALLCMASAVKGKSSYRGREDEEGEWDLVAVAFQPLSEGRMDRQTVIMANTWLDSLLGTGNGNGKKEKPET